MAQQELINFIKDYRDTILHDIIKLYENQIERWEQSRVLYSFKEVERWKLYLRRRDEKEKKFTELMYSRRAALASPSLAGASIWTPTASSLTSPDHREETKSVKTETLHKIKPRNERGDHTGDGGGFGTWLRMDCDSDGGRCKETQTRRKDRRFCDRRWFCRRFGLLSFLRRSHFSFLDESWVYVVNRLLIKGPFGVNLGFGMKKWAVFKIYIYIFRSMTLSK